MKTTEFNRETHTVSVTHKIFIEVKNVWAVVLKKNETQIVYLLQFSLRILRFCE